MAKAEVASARHFSIEPPRAFLLLPTVDTHGSAQPRPFVTYLGDDSGVGAVLDVPHLPSLCSATSGPGASWGNPIDHAWLAIISGMPMAASPAEAQPESGS